MILRRITAHFRKQDWTAIAIDFVIVVLGVFVATRDAGHAFDGRHKAVSEVMAGIRRTHGTAATKKTPILSADLRAMLETLPCCIMTNVASGAT